MAKILDLIYRVKDDASRPIRKIRGEQDGFNTSLKAGITTAKAAALAFTAVGTVVAKLIQEYQDFTIAAGELSQKLNITTEEASVLLEVADDLQIDVGVLEQAFKKMATNGIAPSIAGLIDVRARLDETTSASERMALAQKLLGRAGADLLPMFDQLTNEQLANYVETMGEAKIVTQEEFEAALRNRIAIDAMSDAWDGAKLSVGGFLATGLVPYVEILRVLPGIIDDLMVRFAPFIQLITTPIPQLLFPSAPNTYGPAGPRPQTAVVRRGPVNLFTSERRAGGGPVAGGQPYTVGERGPETFVPGQSGTIVPNNDALAAEVRHLVRTLPTILRDAVERR